MTTKITSLSDISLSPINVENAVVVEADGDLQLKRDARLPNNQSLIWRNAANNADLSLVADPSNNLKYNSLTLVSASLGLIPKSSIEGGGSGGGSGFTLQLVSTAFTAATNTQYLVDTSASAFTGTLPVGADQSAIRFSDDQRNWGINAFTIQPAAGQKIDGFLVNEPLICDLTGATVQLSWDGTKWVIDTNVVLGATTPPPTGGGGSTGSGSGEKNYVNRPDNADADWTSSNVSLVTVATETASSNLPEAATKTTAIKITRVSGTTGYVRYRMVADPADLGKKFKIQWNHKYSGSSGDYTVEMWSFTASDYTTGATQISVANNSIPALANSGTFTTTFDTGSSTQKYLELRVVAVVGTTPIYISGVVVGPGFIIQGAVISEWQSYTPTGSWVTNTAYTGRYRRVGSSAEIMISVDISVGAPTATGLTVTIPSGLTIDTTALANTSQGRPTLGSGQALDSGTRGYPLVVLYDSATQVSFRSAETTGAPGSEVTNTNPFAFNVNDNLTATFLVPISQWASSGVVNLGPGAQVEYAFNTSGITAAGATDSTSFGYGPQGAAIGNINSTTAASFTAMVVQFQYPIQKDDILTLEVDTGSSGATWVSVDSIGFNITTGINLGGAFYGIALASVTSTSVNVWFGNKGRIPSGASVAADGATWAGVSSWRWRVRKTKASVPVGFGAATQDTSGLVKLSQITNYGEKTYIISGKDDATNWTASGAGISVSTEYSVANLPENSTKQTALKILRASGSDYARIRFTLDLADYGKKFKLVWNQKYAGTAGDYQYSVYSNTAADYSGTATLLPSPTSAIPAVNGSFLTNFDAPGSSAPYIELRISGIAGTTPLYLSGIAAGPGLIVQGAAISEWQAFTPTFLNVTINNLGSYWRRVGSDIEVKVDVSASADATGTVIWNMVGGLTGITPDTSKFGARQVFGAGIMLAGTNNYVVGPSFNGTNYQCRFALDTGPNLDASNPTADGGFDTNDRLSFTAVFAVAEWAGSGTVNLGPGAQVEYVYNTSTSTTVSDTTSFAYGPSGAQIQSITGSLQRRVRFQYPIQNDDTIVAEVSEDRIRWVAVTQMFTGQTLSVSVEPYQIQNTVDYGFGRNRVVNSTDVDIYFGVFARASAAGYAGVGDAWGAGAGTFYWRVRKSKSSAPIGFGIADANTAGLISATTQTIGGAKTFSTDGTYTFGNITGSAPSLVMEGSATAVRNIAINSAGTVRGGLRVTAANNFYILSNGSNLNFSADNTTTVHGFIATGGAWTLGVAGFGGTHTVNGALTATGEITAFSDRRLKENIEPLENALSKIKDIRGVSFTKDGLRSVGFIAQEILEILPEVVRENPEGYLSIAYGNVTALLVEAVKELSAKIDKLQEKFNQNN